MSQEVKKSLADISKICCAFNKRIFPQDETGKMFSNEVIADIIRFFVILTFADGVLTADEAAYINDTFDTSYTMDDLHKFAVEEGTEDEASMMTIPLSLTYFIKLDKLFFNEQGIITSHTAQLVELYRHAGIEFMCCDGDLAAEEMDIYNRYISMLEEYAGSELEAGR